MKNIAIDLWEILVILVLVKGLSDKGTTARLNQDRYLMVL